MPLHSQDKKAEEKKAEEKKSEDKKGEDKKEIDKGEYSIYKEMILEDFETTNFTEKNIEFKSSGYQQAKLTIRDQLPSPSQNSKKYLGIKVVGKLGDIYTIKPAKELVIDKYTKTISMWIYGKRFSGEVSVLIQDATGQNHRLIFGKLDFLGWRKLSVPITQKIKQEDSFLNQKRVIKLIQIQYRPANQSRLAEEQTFYIDDISAVVREKYSDRQSDEW
jgi:hypothetical protein